jgi:succinate-acetate transporter protein
MLSAVVGLAVSVVSLLVLIRWRWELLVVVKGLLPMSFFVAGLIAVVAGLSAMRKSEPPVPVSPDKKSE